MVTTNLSVDDVKKLIANLGGVYDDVKELRRDAQFMLPPNDVGPKIASLRGLTHSIAQLPGAEDDEKKLAESFARLPYDSEAFDTLGGRAGVDKRLAPLQEEAERLVEKWRTRRAAAETSK